MFHFPTFNFLAQPAALFSGTLLAALLGFGLFFDHLAHTRPSLQFTALKSWAAAANDALAPASVRRLVRWAVDSGDHRGLPFVVIDKVGARLFAFDAEGRLRASTPVLLGSSRGDAPEVPATPAGRFLAAPRLAGSPGGLIWLGGAGELVLHEPASERVPGQAARRLASSEVEDKRISDGSLHVPPAFFQDHLRPLLGQASVAYVLPEAGPAHGNPIR